MSFLKKIPNNLIKEILDKTDIVNLIKSKIYLKKVGNLFFSLCPFHKESKPSFSVNGKDKFYYCFGCKISGNSIKFLMDFNNSSFIDSIKELSIINNIKIYYESNYNMNNNHIIFHKILNNVLLIYRNNLKNNFNNRVKEFFLYKKWNLDIIEKFNIGYSSDNIITNLFINNKYKFNILIKLGIINKINNKYIDFFNNRIIFPIYNNYNNLISFGGRTLFKKNNVSKYINSYNNFLFKKKNVLYGLNYLLINKKFIDKILIVEGYSDVISLYNFGIDFSVASLGTSLTNEHIDILFKTTNDIVFCYDSDLAGKKSYINILNKILYFITDEKKVRFIFLPNNEDPDSIIKKIGKNKFIDLINNSINFYDLLFDILKKKFFFLSDINNKVKFINEYLYYINKIPGNLTKKLIKKKIINKLLNINKFSITQIIENNISNNVYNIKYTLTQTVISLLIKYPKLCNIFYIPYNLKLLSINFIIIIKIVKLYKNNIYINSYKILNNFINTNIYSYLYYLYKLNNNINYKIINEFFLDLLNKIFIIILNKIQNYLIYKEKNKKLNMNEKKKLWLLTIKLSNLNNNLN